LQGYVKLYRKTMYSPIWQDPYYFKLWMYCLMKASHKEHEQLVGNQLVELKPGEFVTGRTSLAEDLNKGMKPKMKQSEISWWRYLNNLSKWEMLNIKKTNKYSVVAITKWHEYQGNEQQVNNKRTSNEHQMNTNKNGNNVKNDKNNDYSSDFLEFWSLYPRKLDKKKAYKSFKTVIKKHPIDKLLEGTKKYAESVQGTEQKFIKHASTFLNNESFIDGYEEEYEDEIPTVEVTEEQRIRYRLSILSGDLELGEKYFKDKGIVEEYHASVKEYDELERQLRTYQS
jgi:hypothetical protein